MGKTKKGPAYEPAPEKGPPEESDDSIKEAEMEEKRRLRQRYGKSQTIVGGMLNQGSAGVQKTKLGGS